MGDVVTLKPRKTTASRARVANMAADAIANLKKIEETQDQKMEARRTMAQAAENARRAIRELHYHAACNGERIWAARVVRAELATIVEATRPEDAE